MKLISQSSGVSRLAKVYIFYQFLYPDDVVSAIHLTELGVGLVESGWDVTAFPCRRGCRDESNEHLPRDVWQGLKIERIWRPAWKQASTLGRVFNALWMIGRWALLALSRAHTPDVIIIGTDPIFSVLLAPIWRYFKPKTTIVHWCFDLYPEAAYADGILARDGLLAWILQQVLKSSYKACDLVIDIGQCMRQLLLKYDESMRLATCVPWALAEPQYPVGIANAEREAVFGCAKLAMIYSGTFGRAHSCEDMIELARLLSDDDVHLAFSVRGNCELDLQAFIRPGDENIHMVSFADAGKLQDRLACADIHVVSLREEWTGTVVPSKFFGALAIGRPVLFCGSRSSAIAKWIEQYSLGWVLSPGDACRIAESIRLFMSDASGMQRLRERCHRVYQDQFSRSSVLRSWEHLLSELVENNKER